MGYFAPCVVWDTVRWSEADWISLFLTMLETNGARASQSSQSKDNTKFCHVKFSSKYNLSPWYFLFTWANNPQSLSWWCDIEAAANLLGHQTPDTSWWWGPHNNHSPPPAPDTDNTCWQPLGPGVCTPWGYWWPWLTVNHSITLAEVFTLRRKVKVNWWWSDLARMGLSYSNSVSV